MGIYGSRFQSTLSVRRATRRLDLTSFRLLISIHALREESDFVGMANFAGQLQFQSTLSVRRATRIVGDAKTAGDISIHALREESDDDAACTGFAEVISIHALREESDLG